RRYQARQAAQKSLEKRQAVSHNKIIIEIEALLLDLNQEQFDDIYKVLTKLMNNETVSNDISHDNEISKEEHQKIKLMSLLSNESLQNANNRLVLENKKLTRQNKKLIRKAQSLGAQKKILYNQKLHHISKIHSLVRNSQTMTDTAFRNKIKFLFKINKWKYLSNTIWLASSISQVGNISMRSTIECTKIIYEFLIGEPPFSQIKQAPAFGIMVNESSH
ncbi:13956_t:CDS:2, partial [Cetraspora pellucida]